MGQCGGKVKGAFKQHLFTYSFTQSFKTLLENSLLQSTILGAINKGVKRQGVSLPLSLQTSGRKGRLNTYEQANKKDGSRQ